MLREHTTKRTKSNIGKLHWSRTLLKESSPSKAASRSPARATNSATKPYREAALRPRVSAKVESEGTKITSRKIETKIEIKFVIFKPPTIDTPRSSLYKDGEVKSTKFHITR